jgi:hypothetical protein
VLLSPIGARSCYGAGGWRPGSRCSSLPSRARRAQRSRLTWSASSGRCRVSGWAGVSTSTAGSDAGGAVGAAGTLRRRLVRPRRLLFPGLHRSDLRQLPMVPVRLRVLGVGKRTSGSDPVSVPRSCHQVEVVAETSRFAQRTTLRAPRFSSSRRTSAIAALDQPSSGSAPSSIRSMIAAMAR